MNLVVDNQSQFSEAMEHLKKDISTLRTGRATPAIVEDIPVQAYGSTQLLKTLGSISVQDAKTIVVEPWDKSLLKPIEDAIRQSSLGIQPLTEATLVRVVLPDLSTERRQELVKVLHHKLEAARISLRQVREDIKKQIEKAEKDGLITEDDLFSQNQALDLKIKELNEEVKQIGEKKEAEITKI